MTDDSHKMNLAVWDLPTAISSGGSFTATLGCKCDSGCPPDQWVFEVRDHEGQLVGSARPGDEPVAGTEALYAANVQLAAPASEGLFDWQFSVGAAGEHDSTSVPLRVRVTPEASCRLTVIAVDRLSGNPVEGMKVVVHPYRTQTGSDGSADLELPAGSYRLFVSGKDYFPLRMDGELKADLTIRAELEVDAGPSDAEQWS